MGTTLIQPKKRSRKVNLNKLTAGQRLFVEEMAADLHFDSTAAAKKAGYKAPSQAANKLMKNPTVMAALGHILQQRVERCQLNADDVLEFLRVALFFNPLEYFRPSDDGGWLITDVDQLPEEVGRLIDGMEYKVRENKDGSTTSYFKVSLISKATALQLAMKHVGVEKHEVSHTFKGIDFGELSGEDPADDIEARLIAEEKA